MKAVMVRQDMVSSAVLTRVCVVQLVAKAYHRWQILEATDSSDDITAVVVNFQH